MSAKCPSLTRVDLSHTAIGNQGVAWLGAATTRLTVFDADGLIGLEDAGLRALAENNPQLAEISINNCGQITDGGLTAVAAALQHSGSLSTVCRVAAAAAGAAATARVRDDVRHAT